MAAQATGEHPVIDVDVDPPAELTEPSAPVRPARTGVKGGLRRLTPHLKAWYLVLPVDLVMLSIPAVFATGNFKAVLSMAVLTVALFATGGRYRARLHLSILDELPLLVGRLLTAAAIVAVITALRHEDTVILGNFLRAAAAAIGLVIVGRFLTGWVILYGRRARLVAHGTVLVGTGEAAIELTDLLRRYPQYGLRVVAHVSDAGPVAGVDVPWRGGLDQLDNAIRVTGADVLLVADTSDDARLVDLVRRPRAARCDLLVVPRMREFHTQTGLPDHIGAIPIMRIRQPRLNGPMWLAKRGVDLVFASIALVLVSPLLAVIALAVRLEGGPGVLFKQQRIGLAGRPFILLKFRSMRPVNEAESATNWSIAQDNRVGPVGKVLRRTSMDELPQLWNILRGDMTIVGPRPERPFFVERFSAEHRRYAYRHRVPAGLTGLAQVSGLRGDTPISDRARFDNYYIENWSLWLDVKVFIRTFIEVLRAGGR
ncbi:sugar transferase [Cryptosporangium phraense]|uniref:Sugar transferase n=1 Tax=Cryptosporangium phraense TaxID=2593070 RepID=A0A545AJ22_9ACTN|nr:sugar transferase [Cryptosporangium phraense]